MTKEALSFLLVPDGSAARRVRRLIAEQGACSGVVVGSWPELVEWARRSYLCRRRLMTGSRSLARRLQRSRTRSGRRVSRWRPVETAGAVGSALVAVLSATDPARESRGARASQALAARPRRHLADLLRLAQALGGRLPPELAGHPGAAGGGCERRAAHDVR